jgi:hypothetical protein
MIYCIPMEILSVIVIIFIIIHFFSNRKIKKDIVSLKKRISDIEISSVETPNWGVSTEGTQSELPPDDQFINNDLLKTVEKEQEPDLQKDKLINTEPSNKKNQWKKVIILLKRFEHIFIESWIAIIAVVILVAGISFFGIWASTQISPQFRFWIIVAASIFIAGLSVFAGKYKKFQPLALWLRSAAAAVYLFATIGAGGIPGIQWIESAFMGLVMLISGILVNIILAFIGKKQVFSSLHIILGIVAISIAPQSVITLVVATIITFSGIAISYKRKWDFHHLFSILFYFAFIIYWGFEVDATNSFYNISAVSAIVVTALITLFMHYRRIYADSGFEVIPLVVHLVNWLFLSVGLLKFVPETDYVFIPLFISGVLLFILAGRAKKLKIGWLFSTDSLISQLMILLAIVSFVKFDLSNFLIIFLVLIESIGFLVIIWREKELIAHTIGFFISSLAGIALLLTGLEKFIRNGSVEIWVYSGLFALSAIAMSAYLIFVSKQDFKVLISTNGIKFKILSVLHKINLIIQGLLIPLFIFGIYLLILSNDMISDYIGPDTITVPLFIALLFVKYRIKNMGMKIGIIIFLVFETLIAMLLIVFEVDASFVPLLAFSMPVFLVALSLLVYSLKKQTGIHKKIPGLYLFSIHLLFVTYVGFEYVSNLLVGLSWLILALVFLGTSNLIKSFKISESMLPKLKQGLVNSGYLFLISFVVRFLFIDIYKDTMILTTIRGEYLLEFVSLVTMGLWYFFNKNRRLLDLLFLEIAIVYLILVLFIEVPVTILPAVFMVLSISLLFIGIFSKNSLSRLRIVSILPAWISAFLIGFVTSPYLSSTLSYTDTAWIMSAIGIILQFVFLALFHFSHRSDQISLPVKVLKLENFVNKLISGKNIFLYYPVFISVLFFFIWSFNGAVLTALISFEALLILILSLLVKEDSFRYTALAGIVVSIIRLVFFDLREADIFIKAIAFIVVSIIMLLMNVLYNKFKDRIEDKTD